MTFFFYLLRHNEERFRSCNILFYQHRALCLRLYLSVAVIHLCHKKRAPTETLGESPPQPESMEPPGLKYEHIQGIFIYFYTFLHQNFAACLCDEASPRTTRRIWSGSGTSDPASCCGCCCLFTLLSAACCVQTKPQVTGRCLRNSRWRPSTPRSRPRQKSP